MNISFQLNLNELPSAILVPLTTKAVAQELFSEIARLVNVPIEALRADFKGEKNEVHTVYSPLTKVFLLGLGDAPSSQHRIRSFRYFSHRYAKKIPSALAVYFPALNSNTEIEEAIIGLFLGTYKIGRFKTEDNSTSHPFDDESANITVVADLSEATAIKVANRGLAVAETQMRIMDLVNAPSNKKTPQILARWAITSAKKYGYKATIWDKAQIEEAQMGALLAVNKGSEDPPSLIIMEYKSDEATQKVGIVGKGVTFDTGGLSIKPSTNMHYMKSDMGGAAAVLGTMELVAKLKLPVHLIGIIPATDNSVDALSFKPSDVIQSYSGKTIEIIDTDAEGRLILADAISYMVRNYQPDVLIDLATLTGSAVRTFGYEAAALCSNNDALHDSLKKASEATGERFWRLPIWKEYGEDLKSDVADVRNYSGKPLAGAIFAAKFLEVFTDEHPKWAHLDIAGVAFSEVEFSSQKSATGYGIRLLVKYLEELNR